MLPGVGEIVPRGAPFLFKLHDAPAGLVFTVISCDLPSIIVEQAGSNNKPQHKVIDRWKFPGAAGS